MDLHVPECGDWEQTPQPLLLDIPYRKDDAAPYTPYQSDFAKRGFIGARLDCRGTEGSEGVNTDEYTEQEQLDTDVCAVTVSNAGGCGYLMNRHKSQISSETIIICYHTGSPTGFLSGLESPGAMTGSRTA